MSVVLNQSRKLLIAQQKSELNYRLMLISGRMQLTAAHVAELTQEKATISKNEMKKLVEEGAASLTLENVSNIANMTTDIDMELTLLEIKDSDMEAEMKMIETQLQALTSEEEEIDKTLNNSIKKEFGTFSN